MRRRYKIKISKLLLSALIVFVILDWKSLYRTFILPATTDEIEVLVVYLFGEKIAIYLNDDAECILDDTTVKSDNKICVFDFKNKINKIYTIDKFERKKTHIINEEFSIVDEINPYESTIYLALYAEDKMNYKVVSRGDVHEKLVFESEDEDVVKVDEAGNIKAIDVGETNIKLKLRGIESSVKVIVTDLIIPMPDEPDVQKELLPCGIYSEKENDFLDEILKNRVEDAGYKTRAGAVAAARFLGLEFPYRIGYFSENGRLYAVDGEGRYYHEGLYLNKSRYENIISTMYGPGPWGCYIYSVPTEKEVANGLDCSGFITWILKQAGYDPGDLGAGISEGYEDMTDLGTRTRLPEALADGRVKVGDLLSGDGETDHAYYGGHIAMLVGMHDGYYYVAEEMWYGTGYFGAIIRTYSEDRFKYYFYWHIAMDDFYGSDGELTDYWK